jgi:tetratricopeptide (TPR) repeat protein
LIDEHGIVRNNRAHPDDLVPFMERNFQPNSEPVKADASLPKQPSEVERLIDSGNQFLNSGDPEQISQAIEAFDKAFQLDAKNGKSLFSLGVAYRARYDSGHAQPGDFKKAAHFWTQALATNPNQYIWRRRIQQYGPRQIKRYAFYDWINTAIREIKERGETPIELTVPLSTAEVSKPHNTFQINQAEATNPDPEAKITLDDANRAKLTAVVMPSEVKPGRPIRVHLSIAPNAVKWNNEAGPMIIWINESSNGTPEARLIELPVPAEPATDETRTVEFEFLTAEDQPKCLIDAYLLFYACDQDGSCYYLRQNFNIAVALNHDEKGKQPNQPK